MSSLVDRSRNFTGLLIVVTLTAFQAGVAEAKKIDGKQLLDPNRLIEIRVELPPDDWRQLCRQSRNAATAFSGLPGENPYTYFKADLWIDGVKIESVGVRKKGFFGSADFQRPSLKVKFDEFQDQDPIQGLSRLTLNNNKQDGSQVSQFLVYRLFRDAGNPAPRSNWAHVIVNGESLGIYSHVESIKKPFLKRCFGDDTGNLYEGSLTDFHPKALDKIEVKTNEEKNDLGDIKRLTDTLAKEGNLDLDELGRIIDLDSFFRHWALESLTGFWDGYASHQNNFYLYFSPKDDDRGYFIPWGADWALTNRGPFSFGDRGTTVIYADSILANRLYHTSGVPERYRATMTRMLDEVWDEDKMLAEIDRIEKLVSPHLHPAQSGTPEALQEVREFIRGRREAIEQALEDWPPNVPPEPRKPAYVVDVGKLSGEFATIFSAGGPDPSATAQADFRLELDGDQIQLDQVSVRAQLFQVPQFGGFGGPPGGGPRGRRPAAPGGPGTSQTPPAPIMIVFTGTRSRGQPITVSLTIDREKFENASDEAINVIGSFREGPSSGFGFGGFGGGPSRSVIGKLQLTKSGTRPGDQIVGNIDLRIVETHGGFFQQRPPQGGFPRQGARNFPPATARLQPLSLQRVLDTDRDGTISEDEIEQAATVLRRLDRNRDGRLSGDELQSPSSRGAIGPPNRPARARPELEDETSTETPNVPPVFNG